MSLVEEEGYGGEYNCPEGQRYDYSQRKCVPKTTTPPGDGNRLPKEPSPPRGGWRECETRPWRHRQCYDRAKWWYRYHRSWPFWWFWSDRWPIPIGWPKGRGGGMCSRVYGGTCRRECSFGNSLICYDCQLACGGTRGTGGDINIYNINNEFNNPGYGAPREGEQEPAPPAAPAFDINTLLQNPVVLIGGLLVIVMMLKK